MFDARDFATMVVRARNVRCPRHEFRHFSDHLSRHILPMGFTFFLGAYLPGIMLRQARSIGRGAPLTRSLPQVRPSPYALSLRRWRIIGATHLTELLAESAVKTRRRKGGACCSAQSQSFL